MTEQSSTTSDLSVATANNELDKTPVTAAANSMTSSFVIGTDFYLKFTVLLMGAGGTVGNGLILYAMVASKQHKKQVLIFNQNALDLFSSFNLIVSYGVMIRDFHLTGVVGYWLCILFHSELFVWWGTNGSMVNLAIITIDRYLKVVHPAVSKKIFAPLGDIFSSGILVVRGDCIQHIPGVLFNASDRRDLLQFFHLCELHG